MYAEIYKVRPWLEAPAQLLQWADYALVQVSLDNVTTNLTKFWQLLETYKAKASSPQEWGEIMTLDGRAHWTLGGYYKVLAAQQLGNQAGADVVKATAEQAQPEFDKANDLLGQAAQAYDQAQTKDATVQKPVQVARMAQSAKSFSSQNPGYVKDITQNAKDTTFNVRSMLSQSLFGVPTWVLGLGVAGVLLFFLMPRSAE